MFTDLSELDLRELDINISINGEAEYLSEEHQAIVYGLIIEINGTEYVINKLGKECREALEEAAEKELNKQF